MARVAIEGPSGRELVLGMFVRFAEILSKPMTPGREGERFEESWGTGLAVLHFAATQPFARHHGSVTSPHVNPSDVDPNFTANSMFFHHASALRATALRHA